MGSRNVKDIEAQEKPQSVPKERTIKKWKGKDWFTAIAPAFLGSRELGDIPATDSQSVIGRQIVMNLSELTGNPSKHTTKLMFKVVSVDDSTAATAFNGMKLVKEQIFRVVRKRTTKVEIVSNAETKDKWLLHFKLFLILNRTSNREIQRTVRAQAKDFLGDFVKRASLADVVKTASDGLLQKNIKKYGSKVYPIRFSEIVKIDVLKRPTNA